VSWLRLTPDVTQPDNAPNSATTTQAFETSSKFRPRAQFNI
jgi:hypothetical protein